MTDRPNQPDYYWTTGVAFMIYFILYPTTVAPVGPWSNGGGLGLACLLTALLLSWRAFHLNTTSPWMRKFFQLPVTAVITFQFLHDVVLISFISWYA